MSPVNSLVWGCFSYWHLVYAYWLACTPRDRSAVLLGMVAVVPILGLGVSHQEITDDGQRRRFVCCASRHARARRPEDPRVRVLITRRSDMMQPAKNTICLWY